MSLRKLVVEVAKMCGHEEMETASVDLAQLGISSMHPSVKAYFSSSVPTQSIDRPFYQLISASDIALNNTEFTPSLYIIPCGFVTFANEPCGDAIAVDVTDGRVHLVSHEIFRDDGISSFGSDKRTPINREAILENSENTFQTIAEFFESWRDQLIDLSKKEDEFLADAAVDPNAKDEFGNTLLVHRIREGDLKGVKAEIARGANIEMFFGEGRTALGEAVAFGLPKIAKFLIKSGADVNAANEKGTTPLMIAARYTELECIKLLIEAEANRKSVDSDGKTAYQQLCIVHGTSAMKKLLKPTTAKRPSAATRRGKK